jgi:uncharacterized protein (DUF2141 family)
MRVTKQIVPYFFAIVVLLFAPSRLVLSEPPASQPVARLVIKVVDLRNHKGQLIFGVFDSARGFPTTEQFAKNWQVREFDSDTVEFVCELPPGKYGASVLHDENKNNKMDTNFVGIPSEGYGVTNNPKPRFRAATFNESLFDLPPEGATLTISLQYF